MIDVLDKSVPVQLIEGPAIFGSLIRKVRDTGFALDLMEAAHRADAEVLFQRLLPVPGHDLDHVQSLIATDRNVDPYDGAPSWADGGASWFRDGAAQTLQELPPVPRRILAAETGPLPISEIRRLEEEEAQPVRPGPWRRFWRRVDRIVFGDAGFNRGGERTDRY